MQKYLKCVQFKYFLTQEDHSIYIKIKNHIGTYYLILIQIYNIELRTSII